MNYKIVNGSISYGAEILIEEINFEIQEKDKIAIVGRNGAGKTTFLNSIIDNEILDEGLGEEEFKIHKVGNPKIGYLKQISFENSSKTMLEEILEEYTSILNSENKLQVKQEELQKNPSEKAIKDYTNALEEYELQGGYLYKKEYETAIKSFGFHEEDKYKKINEFSGGQKIKIAFLKLLLSKPDILLLDEPTNHLDILSIEWLEDYLKEYPKAIVVVSHDRMFLDKIVNKVYEIEYASMNEYKGNYTDYEEQKAINYEKQLKAYEYQQAEIKRLKAIADRFRFKPTKAKMALSKLKKIEQMTIIEKPRKADIRNFYTNSKIKLESGMNVIKVNNLEIGYEKPLAKVSFELYKGQKLAIIGKNGIGKSTLLKTLNGNIPKISGEFEFGYHVQKEYYDQQIEFENPNNTILEEMSKEFPKLTVTEIRTMLGTFLFSGEDVFKEIRVLSGGEKARLQLCKIIKKGPNLLLLDEPTNHLDIIGKEVLERILKEYKGTIIFITHDRYFINKIADCILDFSGEEVTYYNSSYKEYIECRKKVRENIIQSKSTKNEKSTGANKYFLEKEKSRVKSQINKLEKEIEEKENEIKEIKKKMMKEEISSDYLKLNEMQNKIQDINNQIEEKMLKWEELNKSLISLSS